MSKGKLLAVIIALGVIITVASVSLGQAVSSGDSDGAEAQAAAPQAAEQGDELEPVGDDQVGVGVFNPEMIWHAWEGRAQIEAESQAIQMEMQQAQQSGDQAAMMQAAQKMEQAQHNLLDSFMSAIKSAAPAVADEGNLDVVVGEVVYGADSVAERDISRQLLAEMNKRAADDNDTTEESE